MRVLHKYNSILPHIPHQAMLTMYESFVWPHLNCGDKMYDQTNNVNFYQQIEGVQCKAALAITCAIKGASRTKLYDELDLDLEIVEGGVENFSLYSKSR